MNHFTYLYFSSLSHYGSSVSGSSWSRWLRALLTEAPSDEIISLDFFAAEPFSAILDYMYGKPLPFNIEGAETLLKVIRRLELANLETHCWEYMMSVIDQSNCLILHEFADRYDCPPLKLTAWRMIQETTPAYASMPRNVLESVTNLTTAPGTGLTGPAENFNKAVHGDFQDDEEAMIPSIFQSADSFLPPEERLAHPDELPPDAPAAHVVLAWATRLQDVYNQCVPSYQEKEGGRLQVDWEHELRVVYEALGMPEKIDMVDQILDMYRGKESQMMQSILYKYKDALPAEYTYRLQDIIGNAQ